MVFESLVTNLLNTYLGEFVDNLSPDQLQLGVWSGNVELRNLAIKENAFDALDLPFKVIHGHIDTLKAKIPWTNLYSAPVILEINDVLVVAVPSSSTELDLKKEEEKLDAAKKKQLERIEAAKQKAQQALNNQDVSDGKLKNNERFAAKLAAQIIKNVQIRICNVHISYEDNTTLPQSPFRAGLTLHRLAFETLDSKPIKSSDPDAIIFKEVTLEQLAIYWSCGSSASGHFVRDMPDASSRDVMLRDQISTKASYPSLKKYMQYILSPINFKVKSLIDRNPEADNYTIPIADLDLTLNHFDLTMNRTQLESFLSLIQSLDGMRQEAEVRTRLVISIRRWRPRVPVHGNAKRWWCYAIDVILDTVEAVKSAQKGWHWKWVHIKHHMKKLDDYRKLYTKFLLSENLMTKEEKEDMDSIEKSLDVFNIVLVRSKSEAEAQEHRKKLPPPVEKKGGWLSWIWGGSEEETQQNEARKNQINLVADIKKEMTPEEKAKLYKAIGYEQGADADLSDFPLQYVAYKTNFDLKRFQILLVDDKRSKLHQILSICLHNIHSGIEYRPTATGLFLTFKVNGLSILGSLGQNLVINQASISSSHYPTEKGQALMSIEFDLNPLSGKYDYGLSLNLNGIQLVYDAFTIQSLVNIFKPPDDMEFDGIKSFAELQQLALMKLEQMKERSALGLEYVISEHKQFKVEIDLKPSFLIIPDRGDLDKSERMLILSMGRLTLSSILIDKAKRPQIRELASRHATREQLLETMRKSAYERYQLGINRVQFVLSDKSHWKKDIEEAETSTTATNSRHLLEPLSMSITLERAIITDDPQIPKLIASGSLPEIKLVASNLELATLLEALQWISSSADETDTGKNKKLTVPPPVSTTVIEETRLENDALKLVEKSRHVQKGEEDTISIRGNQLTDLMLDFEIGCVLIELETPEIEQTLLQMRLEKFGVNVLMQTFGMKIDLYIGGVKVRSFLKLSDNTAIDETDLVFTQESKNLLSVKYDFRDPNSPYFKNIIQRLKIKLAHIDIYLHLPSIIAMKGWTELFLAKMPKSQESSKDEQGGKRSRKSSFSSIGRETPKLLRRQRSTAPIKPGEARYDPNSVTNLLVIIECESANLDINKMSIADLKGLSLHFSQLRSERMVLKMSWTDFRAINTLSDKNAIYKEMIKSESERLLSLDVVMYPEKENPPVNMEVNLLFGRLKIVYLNGFIDQILRFSSHFESTKEAVAEASAAAADYARQTAKSAYESATKIKLNIDLEAPSIIVPRNYNSTTCLLVDLGKLKIDNAFKSHRKAILDELTCQLSETRITVLRSESAVLQVDGPNANDFVLRPISFDLKVIRNLNFKNFKGEPEVKISGKLQAIDIDVSQYDLMLALQILNENVSDTWTYGDVTKPSPVVRQVSRAEKDLLTPGVAHVFEQSTLPPTPAEKLMTTATVHEESEDLSEVQKVAYRRFEFAFIMEQVKLSLFDGLRKDVKSQLAEASIKGFEVFGTLNTDDSMAANLRLMEILLQDNRKNRKETGIRKLLYPKQVTLQSDTHENRRGSKHNSRLDPAADSMMSVTFTQSKTERLLQADMKGFSFILALDYILHLNKVLMEALTENKDDIESFQQLSRQRQLELASTPASGVIVQPSSPTASQQPDSAPPMRTSINFFMSQADIVLLESIENTDTYSLILNNELKGDVKQEGEIMWIGANVTNIRLSVTNYDRYVADPSDIDAHILQPTNCHIIASFDSLIGKQNINVALDPVILHVSPYIVNVMTAISSSLGSTGPSEEESSSSDRSRSSVNADIFQPKNIVDTQKLWYFNYDRDLNPMGVIQAQEATEEMVLSPDEEDQVEGQWQRTEKPLLMLKIPSITTVVESGGVDSLPLIKIISSLDGQIVNYGEKINLKTSLQINYFNELNFIWEPMIEPVMPKETAGLGPLSSRLASPWICDMKLRKINTANHQASSNSPQRRSDGGGDEVDQEDKTRTVLKIKSDEQMEMTLTRSAINTLMSLSDSFSHAVKSTKLLQREQLIEIHNELGIDVTLNVSPEDSLILKSPLTPEIEPQLIKTIVVNHGCQVVLKNTATEDRTVGSDMELNVSLIWKENRIDRRISLKRRDVRCFEFAPLQSYPGRSWKWIVEVEHMDAFRKKVIFRSNVFLKNRFNDQQLEVFHLIENDKAKSIGSLKPRGGCFCVPLDIVYSDHAILFVRPNDKFMVSDEGMSWTELSLEKGSCMKIGVCRSKDAKNHKFYVQMKAIVDHVHYEESSAKTLASLDHRIELSPIVKLRNLLPISISYSIENVPDAESQVLESGAEQDLLYLRPEKTHINLKMDNYLDRNWSCFTTLPARRIDPEVDDSDEEQTHVLTFSSNSFQQNVSMEIAIQLGVDPVSGSTIASIFAPFWVINNTGLALGYKIGGGSTCVGGSEPIIFYHAPNVEALLMCFKQKDLFRKKKLSLMVSDSEWSDSFSIDVVGNAGNVICKNRQTKQMFCVSVKITLSHIGLTKIIQIDPFYTLVNRTFDPLDYSEDNDEWHSMMAKELQPLWLHRSKDPILYFRRDPSVPSSKPVSLKESNGTLLTLDAQTIVFVNVDVTEASVCITIDEYFEGCAPIKLINATEDLTIEYEQYGRKAKEKSLHLGPMQMVYYTWYEPTGRRELVWSVRRRDSHARSQPDGKIKEGDNLASLYEDELKMNEDGSLHWVSFLDGKQRVFLVTRDAKMAANCLKAFELMNSSFDFELGLAGFGVSLVNDETQNELVYISITKSDTIWELRKHKSKRYKSLSGRQIELLENEYRKELLKSQVDGSSISLMQDTHEKKASKTPALSCRREPLGRVVRDLDKNFRIDISELDNIWMLTPIKGHLRRTSNKGLWLSVAYSEHVLKLHLKVNEIQIDDQRIGSNFPIVMCPVPPPRSIVSEAAPKVFIELSTVVYSQASSRRVKYLSLLIQEFTVQIDLKFVNDLNDLISVALNWASMKTDQKQLISLDLQQAKYEPLRLKIEEAKVLSRKCYFDLIHFSPIKLHMSFTLGGQTGRWPLGLDFIVRSAGVTLTEFKDVLFKLDCFERKNMFMAQTELSGVVTSHYTSQVLRQFYVIVLGLDVIGNPAGLVMGLKQGVGDFFYEPIMGIVEGPEEFAEGLALGVRSLFSHTVGGAAGAIGRITSTIGSGLAGLTFDEEIQRRRRERKTQGGGGFAEGGKELARSFFGGITGIITKPITGAKDDGFEGFVKGIGKGVVGVVAQPATGVADFASGTMSSLKRAVDCTQEAKRKRPRRVFNPDGSLKPYSSYDAHGALILARLRRGAYRLSDLYITHILIPKENGSGTSQPGQTSILMLTNKRIMNLNKCRSANCSEIQYDVEWEVSLDNIKAVHLADREGQFLNDRASGALCIVLEFKEAITPENSKGMLSGMFGPSSPTLLKKEIKFSSESATKWVFDNLMTAMRRSMN